MAFGFEIYDSSGSKVMSSEDFAVCLLDVFTVASTDSGSAEYSATLASNIKVSQTQELEAVDIDNITVFNQMDISVTLDAGTWTVSWSPGVTVTSARDVTIFVWGY